MQGSLRRRRKKRKTGKRLLFLLFLLLLGVAAVQGYRRAAGDMTAAAELFMVRVAAGDRNGAASGLAAGEAGLPGLIAFFSREDVSFTGVGAGRLTGLNGGRTEFYFTCGGRHFSAPLSLVRREGAWLVEAPPGVETVEGAYLIGTEAGCLRFLWEGSERTLPAPAFPLAEEPEPGDLVRIELVGEAVVAVERLEEVILSRLLRRSETELEGEREGVLPLKQHPAVYLVENGSVRTGTAAGLTVGLERLTLALSGTEVAAIKVEEKFEPRKIRVVLRQNLKNPASEALHHRLLRLSGSGPLVLEERRSGLRRTFAAGQVLLVEAAPEGIRVTPAGEESLAFTGRVFLQSGGAGGRIFLYNLDRDGWGGDPPAYRGVLELALLDGLLVAVNELSLEEYLYTVVPSEMPLAFGKEALKAQAVAARTFAYASIFAGGYHAYGAHVDDSVLSQAYNNEREYPLSNEAVEETAGLVLFHDGKVIDAKYFSTSCGFTANGHEVWQGPGGVFPSEPVPYLRAICQVPGERISLDGEAQLRQFLLRDDWPACDRDSPYFRWRVEMSAAELEAAINYNLGPRHRAQPDLVLTREGNDFRSMEIPRNPLGRLLDLRVIRRGEGGNMMILEAEGTNGTYRIITEYNIRSILRPVQYLPGESPVILECHDGSRLEDYGILLSAFAFFDLFRDGAGNLERVVITGGGYGHGAGMSQYGAAGMARKGSGFAEILRHYYPDTRLQRIY